MPRNKQKDLMITQALKMIEAGFIDEVKSLQKRHLFIRYYWLS